MTLSLKPIGYGRKDSAYFALCLAKNDLVWRFFEEIGDKSKNKVMLLLLFSVLILC